MQVTYLSFVADAVILVIGMILYILLAVFATRREEKNRSFSKMEKVVMAFVAYALLSVIMLTILHAGTALVVLAFPAINHPPIYF